MFAYHINESQFDVVTIWNKAIIADVLQRTSHGASKRRRRGAHMESKLTALLFSLFTPVHCMMIIPKPA